MLTDVARVAAMLRRAVRRLVVLDSDLIRDGWRHHHTLDARHDRSSGSVAGGKGLVGCFINRVERAIPFHVSAQAAGTGRNRIASTTVSAADLTDSSPKRTTNADPIPTRLNSPRKATGVPHITLSASPRHSRPHADEGLSDDEYSPRGVDPDAPRSSDLLEAHR